MQLKRKGATAQRFVEVIGRDGHVLRLYAVAIEEADADAEYEEVALVLAEQDGLNRPGRRLRARCVR
ncbi:MAG TPA: hypothetical protein VHC42_01465 [Rhizomicrobium sp.]|nr:hypothetical protein [Rhizomicrobium sp.]HVV64107.1 hypothetical protein [Rhizomicrobium sp.]